MFDSIREWLHQCNVSFSEEEKSLIKKCTGAGVIPRNTVFVPQGKPATKLYFLNKGIVRLYRVQQNTDITIDFISAGEFISSAIYVLNEAPSPCAMEALTDVEILYWERKDIITIKSNSPNAALLENALLERMLTWNQNREVNFMTLSAEERYINLMEQQPDIIRYVPLKYVASYLGIHQDSLSRIRKKIMQRV
jgi:CRP-like cAMP-binding protein